jgi:myosin heavy subunit
MYEEYDVKERLSELEQLFGAFIVRTDKVLYNTNKSIERLSDEMREFKDEMREFKDEMKEFKDGMKEFKDEMKEFKDEMKEFKDEMKEFKDEMKEFKDEMKEFKDEMKEFKDQTVASGDRMEADRKEMARQWNKQWGELANKMGTLVEDIIAPAVRPVMAQCFKEEVDYRAVNVRKHDKATGLRGEFDVVASSQSYVFLVETKSSPKVSDITHLLEQKVPRFRELFPEFADLKMIPVLASLRFEDSMLQPATEAGVFLMAYREWEYMDLINFNELKGGL